MNALERLNGLQGRFLRDQEFFVRYSNVISGYLSKGHAELVPDEKDYKPRWCLPLHAVKNPEGPTKLRVGSRCAERFQGRSLNGYLLQGPNKTTSLVGLILRFRKDPIALAADIEEMFLQMRVPVRESSLEVSVVGGRSVGRQPG